MCGIALRYIAGHVVDAPFVGANRGIFESPKHSAQTLPSPDMGMGAPSLASLIPGNAPIASRCINLRPATILKIPFASYKTNVASAVVERIAVDVVNVMALWRVQNQAVQVRRLAVDRCAHVTTGGIPCIIAEKMLVPAVNQNPVHISLSYVG